MHRFLHTPKHLLYISLFLLSVISHALGIGEVLWAVNCGGEAHTDIHGIRYKKDSLSTGISSDYGKALLIQRVVPQDQILYQTERYDTNNFGYEIPIKTPGEYVLVLKFSEVWFTTPNSKVFDVQINEHTIVEGLDIFAKVGRGTAHDEIVPFVIKNGKLTVQGESSTFDGKISISFVKGDRDNPKINALFVMKGALDDVPLLPPMQGMERPTIEEEEEEEEQDDDSKKEKKPHRPSGPKVQDPYASEDTGTMMLPIVVAIGAFIPLVFCLCKL